MLLDNGPESAEPALQRAVVSHELIEVGVVPLGHEQLLGYGRKGEVNNGIVS